MANKKWVKYSKWGCLLGMEKLPLKEKEMSKTSSIGTIIINFWEHTHLMFDLCVACMCFHISSSAMVPLPSRLLPGLMPGSLHAQLHTWFFLCCHQKSASHGQRELPNIIWTQGHQPTNVSHNGDKNTFKINANSASSYAEAITLQNVQL